MGLLTDVLADAFTDTIKLVPFLLVTYLVMEYLERKTQDKSTDMLARVGRFGPLFGGAVGAVPQCGFSAAASSLYSGGVISLGSLIAVFLSTSDEMLPIFLSEKVPARTILGILAGKVAIGAVTGFAVDFAVRALHQYRKRIRPSHMHGKWENPKEDEKHIHDLCEQEHCGCEEGEGGIIKSAFVHTLHITLFIFAISAVITLIVETAGEDAIVRILSGKKILGTFLAGIIGLIPNCAASVTITQLYLQGLLGAGQMMAGLLVGAGVGLLVLFRTNRHLKENLCIAALLYACGVIWGLLIELLIIH